MYKLDPGSNRVHKVSPKTFAELGFREREHLQEWIAGNSDVFDEELLIIQKEFNGFHDTNERLDLLALDKQGNLVVIENKLDDSGKDVTWQALKYASYCSSLTKDQIREIYQKYLDKQDRNEAAQERLRDFYGTDYEDLQINLGVTQRIIIVAANFRKEVTSTVLWLMNFKLRIQCFKVTPYVEKEHVFLMFEQIIPMKESEEYTISMAEKAQSDISSQEEIKNRHPIRIRFWKQLLAELAAAKKSDLFSNINPTKDNWISAGSGISGVSYTFVITKSYACVELLIQRPIKEEGKFIFDQLLQHKSIIEAAFGSPLRWDRKEESKVSIISTELTGVNVFNEEDWTSMIAFMAEAMPKFHKAVQEPLGKVKVLLNQQYYRREGS